MKKAVCNKYMKICKWKECYLQHISVLEHNLDGGG